MTTSPSASGYATKEVTPGDSVCFIAASVGVMVVCILYQNDLSDFGLPFLIMVIRVLHCLPFIRHAESLLA